MASTCRSDPVTRDSPLSSVTLREGRFEKAASHQKEDYHKAWEEDRQVQGRVASAWEVSAASRSHLQAPF